jgi:hypothetical protein
MIRLGLPSRQQYRARSLAGDLVEQGSPVHPVLRRLVADDLKHGCRLPKRLQRRVKAALHEVMYAETREQAREAITRFATARTYSSSSEPASSSWTACSARETQQAGSGSLVLATDLLRPQQPPVGTTH